MKYTKIAAAMLSCALLLGGCSNVKGTDIVMKVGDENISAGMYKFYLTSFQRNGLSADEAKDVAKEQCENNYKIVAAAKAMGVEFDEAKTQEIADYKQQVVDSYDGEYENFLKENDLTDGDIDNIISVTYYGEALQEKMGDGTYTDEEKREFFKNNYRRAKHILISSGDNDDEAKKKAEDLLERAKNGEDFDTLMSENSEDPGSKSNPDGYVFTDNEMVAEFQDGVDSLKPGELTLVKSSYGYHVIKRLALDETPEYFEAEYAKVAENLDKKMQNKKFEEQLYAWVDEYGIMTETDDSKIDSIVKQAAKENEKSSK